jgi:hypothetical protein
LRIADTVKFEIGGADIETKAFAPLESPWNRGSDFVLSPASLALLGDVDIFAAVFGAESWVVFDQQGTPSSSGSVSLSSGGKSLVLVLDPLSGAFTRP